MGAVRYSTLRLSQYYLVDCARNSRNEQDSAGDCGQGRRRERGDGEAQNTRGKTSSESLQNRYAKSITN